LLAVGLEDHRVFVHKDIIQLLISVDKEFQKRNFRLYVKEGYRSKALYEIVYTKRVKMFGKEETDRVLNMKDMPHASGKTVDISLIDMSSNELVEIRDKSHGTDALFINFYRNKNDENSKRYQELQDYILQVMTKHGFELGTKKEYFHFNFVG